MKQANILTSAAAYKTDHCAGRGNKFLCVYLFAQAAHAAEQQRRRLRRLICALFRSHKQAHVVPSGRGRAGQRGGILSIFIKRLTHVQFSSVRGWPTFSLPSGWAVANICLTSTWTWTQSTNTQPQATPSHRAVMVAGVSGYMTMEYLVLLGPLSSFQHHLSCHGLALMHRFSTSPLGCQSPLLLCGLWAGQKMSRFQFPDIYRQFHAHSPF